MEEHHNKISEICKELCASHDGINLAMAYEWGKHIAIYHNDIEEDINMDALRMFCIKNIGPESDSNKTQESIQIDYDEFGLIIFHRFGINKWLVIGTDKRSFGLVSMKLKEISEKEIEFDLIEIKQEEIEQIESNVTHHSLDEDDYDDTIVVADQKILAARRLQLSILPDTTFLNSFFNKHFVYFQPEDLLGGDFYWVHEFEDEIFIAVADCTGHSIEGAMATMTVSTILNQEVAPGKKPQEIIEEIYAKIKKSSNTSNAGYAVGVEMAICRFQKSNHQVDIVTTGVPVLYIEDANHQHLLKIKGTQQPDYNELKIDSINLFSEKGHKIIFYTDGLSDQFDSNDRKKLGNAGVKKIFSTMNGSFSYDKFDDILETWRGDTKPLDDITVMAIQV